MKVLVISVIGFLVCQPLSSDQEFTFTKDPHRLSQFVDELNVVGIIPIETRGRKSDGSIFITVEDGVLESSIQTVLDSHIPKSDLVVNQENIRSSAETSVDDFNPEGVRLRAALLVIMDEINLLRTKLLLPERNITQLKNTVKGKITSQAAD